ncbi:cofilin-2-like [Cheilinus undulatus]|uniref:cofilin-2-like n=1 Tax=Cheilinus undulatus TaxID=241271 RepID=UPI001BD348CC|nr:cofilin-2-like [Cheilinus undulatus]
MTSGVKVDDEVIAVFKDMKLGVKKAVLFYLSADKIIMVEEGNQILVSDIGKTVDDPYACFIKLFPPDDCRFALYDASYETKETRRQDLVFIFWSPEEASIRSKMLYASSKYAIERIFKGVKYEWLVTELEKLQDRRMLAQILGNDVVSLEGKPL